MPPRDPPEEGMIDWKTFEKDDEVRQRDAAAEKAQNVIDSISPTLTKDKLREYKEGARKMIEERLANKRRQRRLMRGGTLEA
jgi:hypothetical protein